MDIAILSDIHSNYTALERCMEYALSRGISRFIFLGDYVGELAYPERTMERLFSYREKYDCTFIRGNKEEYWIRQRAEGGNDWKEYDSTTGALWYAYHRLRPEDIDFFQELPIAREVRFEGLPALTVCHGSPENVKEQLWADTERTKAIMGNAEGSHILCGHTHLQFAYRHQGVKLLNPGSVGLSWKADGRSQFMILHGERGSWREEFITMDYDRQEAEKQLEESGLAERAPYWCRVTVRQLRGGQPEITHADVLERVMKLCHEETGQWSWPDLPEKYWDMAFQELFGAEE
ncbi:MAG: metallophosphatase family protein [Acetatifactor sp.]|nr:metallophosphatase family protein [Acetatifactor sp.]